MFKFLAKLTIVSFAFIGVGLFIAPSENVSAAVCPSGYPVSVPPFGFNKGEADDGFAGLVVHARVGNMTNGSRPGNYGQKVPISYRLNSRMPNPSPGTHYPPLPPNVNYTQHARIFQLDGSGSNIGRTESHTFRTNETIYSGNESASCTGFSVLGPGKTDERGNRWALDCGQAELNSQGEKVGTKATRFWINDIPNPFGQSGHWTIHVGGAVYRDGEMNFSNGFTVTNGMTQQIQLVWHENPNEIDDDGECTHIWFTIPNDNQDGQGGDSVYSDYAIYVNDFGSPGHPAAAGSPDYQDGQVYGAPPGPGVDYEGRVNEPQHRGGTVTKNLRYDNKAVTGTLRYTVVIYDGFTNSNGNYVIKVRSRFTRVVNNCWQATCSLHINSTIFGRANAVRAGENIGGSLTITNTSQHNLPSAMITNSGNFQLAGTTTWFGGLNPLPLPTNIPAGQSRSISLSTFNLVAPSNPGQYTLSVYPDYWGRAGIGPSCPVTINVYKQFSLNLTASTSMQPDNEDPSVVQHRGTIGPNNPHVVVPYSARSTLNGSIIHSVNASGGTTINYAYDHTSFPNLNAGDTYCTSISTPNGSGWVGPGNDLVDADDPRSSNTACATVHDRPYLRVYGADVAAWNLCSPGDIRAYISSRSGKTGSGGQLGVFSIGGIDGFISASLRYTLANPKPPKGLTFGNLSGTYGGNFGAGECPPDYFASRDGSAESFNGNLGGTMRTRSGKFNANNTSGPTTISNGLNLTGKKTIYVEGDAYITGTGITYANTGNYGSVEDIPRFTLIASGNIYIAPGVITLDGTYVAGGKISTCATASGSHNTSQLWGACRGSRLVINGAFIAPEVEFLRSRGSLRSSSQSNDAATRTNAAEVFIYSPEVYLAQMLGESTGPSAGSQIYQPRSYDAITTLPPIL